MNHTISAALDRPWMKALEMQFAAMGLLQFASKAYLQDNPTGDVSRMKLEMEHLKSAGAYDWSIDMTTAVRMASRSIPGSTLLDDVSLEHAGWWWFGVNEQLPAAALLWSRRLDGVLLSWYVLDDKSRPMSQFVWGWPFGDSLTGMLADLVEKNTQTRKELRSNLPKLETLSRFFLAGNAWLHQRIITFSTGHIERHRRKQLAREHNTPVAADVKVIQLRRTESQSRPPSAGGAEPVEWSCRWIVNGHWRNQPYPSKDKRELIYIMPYVKGPDDQPLKVPTHTVYQVSR